MPDWLRRLAGKDSGSDPKKEAQASPVANPYAFVVPNYLRGSPYSAMAVPTYADNLSRGGPKDRYDTPMEQHREWPKATARPDSTKPPAEWSGYNQDQIIRSKEQEWVLNADEGPRAWIDQYRWQNHLNPYEFTANVVVRPQRPPHEYSMIRDPDHNYLGRRDLTGEHYSAAQTVTDQQALALKGMVPNRHRRSTVRVEPIAYGELTNTVARRSGFSPNQASATAPDSSFSSRSFRLT